MLGYSEFGLAAAASNFPIYYIMRLKTVLLLRKQTNRKLYANIRGIVIFLFYPLRYIYLSLSLSLVCICGHNCHLKSFVSVFSSHSALPKHKSKLNGIHKSINRTIDR